MSPERAVVEVSVAMQVSDLLELIQRRYGGLERLESHLARHKADRVAILLFEAAEQNKNRPEETIRLTEVVFGDPGETLAFTKLQLLGAIMGRPRISVRELARLLGKNPATVLEQVAQLENAGLVVKDSLGPGHPASIRPLVRELNIRVSPATG